MKSLTSSSPWIHGRPIRSRRGRVVLPEMTAWTQRTDGDPASERAEIWIEAARHAVSSVASFRWAALSLEAVGAPGDLIQRAIRAADDEAAHSLVYLELAKQWGAPDDISVLTSPCELTRHRRRPDNLLESATSALIDGVVGEGFAMRRLGIAAERCPELCTQLQRLAADEEFHAELGRDIMLWCVSVRPWIVSDLALELESISSTAPIPDHTGGLSPDELACVGMCPREDAQLAWDDVLEQARVLVASARSLV